VPTTRIRNAGILSGGFHAAHGNSQEKGDVAYKRDIERSKSYQASSIDHDMQGVAGSS